MSGAVWLVIWILLGALALEVLSPKLMTEGFQSFSESPSTLITATDIAVKPTILSNQILRRGDVSVGREEGGYEQDGRYFRGYTDVQRYGFKNDFCRVVRPQGELENESFFACALAGTKDVTTLAFRSISVKNGLRLSRDDYMHDILKDGREAYCRILKGKDGMYQPYCIRALDTSFAEKDQVDPDPPEEIKTLLNFYDSCRLWFRFRDDMIDTMGVTKVSIAGGMSIDETPRPAITRGLHFNGQDQFLRISDAPDLSFGNKVNMRSIRAFSIWVYFDEFTNNAHIFDFGDGPGKNNTFLGILGKGDGGNTADLRPESDCPETTVPDSPSGAQFSPEIRAQELLESSCGNVDAFDCKGPEVRARRLPPSSVRPEKKQSGGELATLLYEVWDSTLRKVQVKINRVIPLKKWTHILITATTMDALRPDLQFYINGKPVYTELTAFLPQAKTTSNNYLGRSNWANETSGYELRDEAFSGSLFDFRMYSAPITDRKREAIVKWGKGLLGLLPDSDG